MSTLFNESEADKKVIKILLRELKKRSPMSQLFKLEDGRVIRAIDYEEVSPEELQSLAVELAEGLAEIQSLLPPAATPAVPEQPETPVAAPAPTPAEPEAPVDATPAVPEQPITQATLEMRPIMPQTPAPVDAIPIQ